MYHILIIAWTTKLTFLKIFAFYTSIFQFIIKPHKMRYLTFKRLKVYEFPEYKNFKKSLLRITSFVHFPQKNSLFFWVWHCSYKGKVLKKINKVAQTKNIMKTYITFVIFAFHGTPTKQADAKKATVDEPELKIENVCQLKKIMVNQSCGFIFIGSTWSKEANSAYNFSYSSVF